MKIDIIMLEASEIIMMTPTTVDSEGNGNILTREEDDYLIDRAELGLSNEVPDECPSYTRREDGTFRTKKKLHSLQQQQKQQKQRKEKDTPPHER